MTIACKCFWYVPYLTFGNSGHCKDEGVEGKGGKREMKREKRERNGETEVSACK